MAPRRAHNKSRNGCVCCRRRKVKCDERGPPCGPCTNRQIHCTYLHSNQPSKPNHPNGYDAKSNPHQTIAVPEPRPKPSRNLLELELMHQWSTKTYKSFCGDMEAEYYTWQVILSRESLQHPFLLDEMLAMASLEIAALQERSNHMSYVSRALEYHDSALKSFRAELDNITPDKQQAVLAFSLLAMALGLAFPHFTKSCDEPQSMVQNIIEHFELVHGVWLLVWKHFDELKEAPIMRSLPSFSDIENQPLEPSVQSAIARLNTLNDAQHNDPTPQDQSPASKLESIAYHAACRRAIFHLEDLFGKCTKPEHRGFALAWLNFTGREFIGALRNKDSVALLILMNWGVLIDRCSLGIWWVKPIGESLVGELTSALATEMDPQMRAGVEWVRREVIAGS